MREYSTYLRVVLNLELIPPLHILRSLSLRRGQLSSLMASVGHITYYVLVSRAEQIGSLCQE